MSRHYSTPTVTENYSYAIEVLRCAGVQDKVFTDECIVNCIPTSAKLHNVDAIWNLSQVKDSRSNNFFNVCEHASIDFYVDDEGNFYYEITFTTDYGDEGFSETVGYHKVNFDLFDKYKDNFDELKYS